MKVDIEGEEYETLWSMLQKKSLCQGVVDQVFVEAHKWGDITEWQDERTYAALQKRIGQADCGLGGIPSQVLEFDDETYVLDDPEGEQREARRITFVWRLKQCVFMVSLLGVASFSYYTYQLKM